MGHAGHKNGDELKSEKRELSSASQTPSTYPTEPTDIYQELSVTLFG